MTFKERVQRDIKNTFLDLKVFGEEHIISEKPMTIIIDENELMERKKRQGDHMDGMYVNQKLIYVAASDFGALPKQGSKLFIDRQLYTVKDAVSEDGIYSITIEANKGR